MVILALTIMILSGSGVHGVAEQTSQVSKVKLTLVVPVQLSSIDISRTSITVSIDESAGSKCKLDARPETSRTALSCIVELTLGVHDLQVQVAFPQYRTSTRNVPRVRITESGEINLGEFRVERLPMPEVVRVLDAVSDKGSQFDIYLRDVTGLKYRITQLDIEAQKHFACASLNPVEGFKIEDSIVIISAAADGSLNVAATAKSLSAGDQHTVQLTGRIVGPCELKILTLTIPLAVPLDAEYTMIRVSVPNRFKIVGTWFAPHPLHPTSSDSVSDSGPRKDGAPILQGFNNYRFNLSVVSDAGLGTVTGHARTDSHLLFPHKR
jgi:hypothetical protein